MSAAALLLLALLAVLVLGEGSGQLARAPWPGAHRVAGLSCLPPLTPPPPLSTLSAAVVLKRLVGGPRGSVVLLVGPCDAGKTTLFHQLVEGSTHLGTVASMLANEASGPLASEKVGWGVVAFASACALAAHCISKAPSDSFCAPGCPSAPSYECLLHRPERAGTAAPSQLCPSPAPTRCRPPTQAPAPSHWWTCLVIRASGAPWSATPTAPQAWCLWWTQWTSCPARRRRQSECCGMNVLLRVQQVGLVLVVNWTSYLASRRPQSELRRCCNAAPLQLVAVACWTASDAAQQALLLH